jgi:hypothetical protein
MIDYGVLVEQTPKRYGVAVAAARPVLFHRYNCRNNGGAGLQTSVLVESKEDELNRGRQLGRGR